MGSQDSNPIFWRSIIGLTCLWFIDFGEKSWVDQQCYRLCYRAVHGSEFMPLHSYVSADVHGATHELRQSPLTWQCFSRNRPATKCAGTAGGYSSDADVIWMVQIGLQLIYILLVIIITTHYYYFNIFLYIIIYILITGELFKLKLSPCLYYLVQIYPGAVELMQVIEDFIHIVGLGMKDFHNAYLMTGNLGKNRPTLPSGPQPLRSFYHLFSAWYGHIIPVLLWLLVSISPPSLI